MNKNHQAAIAALREVDKLSQTHGVTEASAIGAMQTRAILAVAEEQAKVNQQLELGNMIAYAQLQRARRRPSMELEELVDVRMASAFPELGEVILPDDDEDGI